jgi:hypothetical protein
MSPEKKITEMNDPGFALDDYQYDIEPKHQFKSRSKSKTSPKYRSR